MAQNLDDIEVAVQVPTTLGNLPKRQNRAGTIDIEDYQPFPPSNAHGVGAVDEISD